MLPRRAAPRSRPRPPGAPVSSELPPVAPAPPAPPAVAPSTSTVRATEEELDFPTLEHDAENMTRRVPRDRVELDPFADGEGVFPALREFLEQELAHAKEDRRQRAILRYELGQLDETVFGEAQKAVAHYEAAFKEDPSFIPALRALRRHYLSGARYRDYLRVLETEVNVTANAEHKAAMLTHAGEILADRLADTEAAIEKLKAAIVITPRSRRAVEMLRGIYARQERWPDVLEVLRGLTTITGDAAERARLTAEMAGIHELRLGDDARAEELYTQALALDSQNEAAAVSLRRLYLAHKRWKELAELLAREAGREQEPEERFADLYRAARIAELHLHDDVRAASLLETAAALRPSDPLPLHALSSIYQRAGRYEDLATALTRQLRLVRDPTDRAGICYRLGRVQEDWLEQPQEAMKAYREALKEQPGNEAALRALGHLLERFERYEELADLLLLRAERCKDMARRADGYVRAAAICEQRLGDLPRAVDLYDRAYRMVPGLPEAYRALGGIYRRSEQWDALAELQEREAGATKDRALGVSLLRAAAWLYEEELKNRERAIATLEKLLALEPGDRETLVDLARLYEDVGKMEELRRTLEAWAGVTEDPRERVELRRRIGELLEGPLRRVEQAVDVYRAILKDEPTDRPTLERLKAIFERSGRWQDLVETLRAEIQVTPLGPEQAPLFLQIGLLSRDKLGDVAGARGAFDEALKVDASFTPAKAALQELLRAAEHWDRLVEMLVQNAERVREPVRAAALLCNAAEVCEEQLGDRPQAERLYNRALELDPGAGPARQGLERLYLGELDRAALEAHYLREAESTQNAQLRLRAYLRLGTLFDGPAADPVGAAAAYESALQVITDQPDALRALAAVLRRTGAWERLASLLARVAGTAQDRDTAVAALKEWAGIVESHLADKWDPAPIYERILEGEPTDLSAILSLEALAFERNEAESLVSLAIRQLTLGGEEDLQASLAHRAATLLLSWGRADEAAEVLRDTLKRSGGYLPAVRLLRVIDEGLGEWNEAAELLLREGDLCVNPETAQAALVRAGNVLLDRFGDEARARAAFERVFSKDPSHAAAFGRLASILASVEDWGALVELYRRRMQVLDPPTRVPLQLELALLYRDSLLDATAAIEVLRELLEVDPANEKALQEVSSLCVGQQRWREAEGYLAELVHAARHDPATRRAALLQRSEILEERLGDEEAAMAVLQQLLEEFPHDRDALNRCMVYYQHRGDWEKTVGVLEELVRSGTAPERINHLVNMAEIYSRTLSDPTRTRSALRRAATLCLDAGVGVERLSEYFERRGDFEGLVEYLGEALEQLPPEGTPGSVAMRLARARVLAGRLLRPTDAESEIHRALESDPGSVAARLELAGLHLWGDNLGEAISEYQRVLDLDPFSADAFRGLYRVYDRRGDMERAAGAAQAVCAVAGREVPERKLAQQAAAPMEAMLSSAVATPLGVSDFWHLLAHPDEPQTARELLYLIADFLPQIFPDDVERAASGIMPIAEEDQLAQRCRQLAQVLGVERFETCIGQNLSASAVALPGVPPRLVVDEGFVTRASAAEFRFAAGRALAGILTRALYLSVLPPRNVELLLAATVELFEKGFAGYLAQRREVDEISRALSRALPRKLRKTLEEPARSYAAGQPVAAAAWYVASQRSGERGGLLLSGDVEAALTVLKAEKASRAVQADLLRFSVGPHLYEARRRLGLSI